MGVVCVVSFVFSFGLLCSLLVSLRVAYSLIALRDLVGCSFDIACVGFWGLCALRD